MCARFWVSVLYYTVLFLSLVLIHSCIQINFVSVHISFHFVFCICLWVFACVFVIVFVYVFQVVFNYIVYLHYFCDFFHLFIFSTIFHCSIFFILVIVCFEILSYLGCTNCSSSAFKISNTSNSTCHSREVHSSFAYLAIANAMHSTIISQFSVLLLNFNFSAVWSLSALFTSCFLVFHF